MASGLLVRNEAALAVCRNEALRTRIANPGQRVLLQWRCAFTVLPKPLVWEAFVRFMPETLFKPCPGRRGRSVRGPGVNASVDVLLIRPDAVEALRVVRCRRIGELELAGRNFC